jgi:hypothetical protein
MSLLRTILRIAQYPSFDLISPLRRDECIRRLREKTDPPGWQVYSGGRKIYDSAASANPKPLAGKIGESDFQVLKRVDHYNSFQPYLFADFANDDSKTRLHCYVGVHPLVIVVMALWFAVAIFLGFVSISQGDSTGTTVNLLGWQHVFRGGWASWVMPMLFLAGGAGVFVYCRYLARGEDKFLVDLVQQIFDAQKV